MPPSPLLLYKRQYCTVSRKMLDSQHAMGSADGGGLAMGVVFPVESVIVREQTGRSTHDDERATYLG